MRSLAARFPGLALADQALRHRSSPPTARDFRRESSISSWRSTCCTSPATCGPASAAAALAARARRLAVGGECQRLFPGADDSDRADLRAAGELHPGRARPGGAAARTASSPRRHGAALVAATGFTEIVDVPDLEADPGALPALLRRRSLRSSPIEPKTIAAAKGACMPRITIEYLRRLKLRAPSRRSGG